jgi:hypothetical protein
VSGPELTVGRGVIDEMVRLFGQALHATGERIGASL